MTGKIIKGIGGFYYVDTPGGIFECKAKGIFRKEKVKPLVGDNVEIEILDSIGKLGNIHLIRSRCNQLIRPAVANVDQVLVIFATADPAPNLNLLDRFLLMVGKQGVRTVICFSKADMVTVQTTEKLMNIYRKCANHVLAISTKESSGMEELLRLIERKTTVLAGPSGVGKSTAINYLYPAARMETGTVSEKIKKGRHTTRHSELFHIGPQTYVMDTPGFSSLLVPDIEKEDLKLYMSDFRPFEGACRFQGCVHINEPDCEIKKQVDLGNISKDRYKNYLQMYEEIKNRKRYS